MLGEEEGGLRRWRRNEGNVKVYRSAPLIEEGHGGCLSGTSEDCGYTIHCDWSALIHSHPILSDR